MQSRIAARPPTWKTSPMALTRPPGASDTDELGAGGATVARRLQEAKPRVMRLRVHHRYAEHLPPVGLVAAYRRDSRGRSRAAPQRHLK